MGRDCGRQRQLSGRRNIAFFLTPRHFGFGPSFCRWRLFAEHRDRCPLCTSVAIAIHHGCTCYTKLHRVFSTVVHLGSSCLKHQQQGLHFGYNMETVVSLPPARESPRSRTFFPSERIDSRKDLFHLRGGVLVPVDFEVQ